MPVHSALYATLLFTSSKAAPARADAVSLMAVMRNAPSPITSFGLDADQSVAFDKALDSGDVRCLVSNQLLCISKRHWSLHEQDEMNKINRRAEQSSRIVSFFHSVDKDKIVHTDAWSVEEIGEDEEGHDESAYDT